MVVYWIVFSGMQPLTDLQLYGTQDVYLISS